MNIDQRQQRDIDALRRNKVGLRYGTVVADPDGAGRLCLNLGNSDQDYVDVKSVGGATLTVGERVPVLVRANDLLVLGGIGTGNGGGGGGPFQPLDPDLTTLAGMPVGLATSIAGMSTVAQDMLDAGSPADLRAVAKDTSYTPPVTVYGHSINYTGSSDGTRGIAHRLGTMLQTDLQMMAVAGSILSINAGNFGAGGGGWDQVYRRTAGIPGTATTAGIGPPRRGPTLFFTGVNDIGALQQDSGAVSGSMVVADFVKFQHPLRAGISRMRASNLWEEDDGVTKNLAGSYKRTSGSPIITDVASYAGITPGLWITGTGIPAATKVLSIDRANSTLTMTANASSGTATATALTFSTLSYQTAYTRSGADPSDSSAMNASGGYYSSTTTVNNGIDIAVPTQFGGGTATVAFLVDTSGHGAIWTVALGGVTVGTLDTRNQNIILSGPTPFWNTCVFRVTDMPPGAQTITVTPTTIGGANVAYFDCWWIESSDPQPVCVPRQYHAWWAYNDADIDRLNDAIDNVVAEFDENVFAIDTTDLMSDSDGAADPVFFNDAIHPNDRGHALIAARIADGFASRARAQGQHARDAHNFPFLTRHPTDTARNILQPNFPSVTPLTLRAANYPVTQSAPMFVIENFDGSDTMFSVTATGGVTADGNLSVGTDAVFGNNGGGAFIGSGRDNLVRLGYKSGTLGDYASAISFALNSNLYETGADEITTDGDLIVNGTLTAGSLGSGAPTTFLDLSNVTTSPDTASGTGTGDKISLYHSTNTNRVGLGVKIGPSLFAYVGAVGSFRVVHADTSGGSHGVDGGTYADVYGANLIANTGATAQTEIGAFGPSSEAALALGSSADTVLYRSAADTFRTADALTVDALLTASTGAKVSGGVLDVSANTTADASAGTGAGDKIALHSSGYGIGVQTASLVLYTLPSGGAVVLKEADASGTKCDGSTYARLFCGDINVADAADIILATGTGTKIGTAASQKLGFFNATPVIQRSAYTQTYATAARTHPAVTSGGLTNANGTADGTIANCTTTYTNTTINNNFRDISDEVNAIAADLLALKKLVNALIDDSQALGFAT